MWATSGLPPCRVHPHCIISTLGWDLIYPSISPLDSEPMGVWNVSHSPLSLNMQCSAGTCHAYRVQWRNHWGLNPSHTTPSIPLPRLVSKATGKRILIWRKKTQKTRNDSLSQVNPRLFINQAQDYFLVFIYHISYSNSHFNDLRCPLLTLGGEGKKSSGKEIFLEMARNSSPFFIRSHPELKWKVTFSMLGRVRCVAPPGNGQASL